MKAGSRIKINELYFQYVVNVVHGITDSRFSHVVHAYAKQFRIDMRNVVFHYEKSEIASVSVREFPHRESSS